MTSTAIEETLVEAEAALDAGRGLSGTGFWSAVSVVKRSPELVERYADRIAVIDARAHRSWALLVLPLWLGTTLALVATLGGLALVWWAYELSQLAAVLSFFAGLAVILVATHGLAHLAVGMAMGMRFSCWFVGKIQQPQPGVKVDYATYLRAPAMRRAWMHASGAITTKLIPFLLIGAAIAAGLPTWVVWVVVAIGVGAVTTDVAWSTKKSDWKKFRREKGFAQEP
jgi:hypothetical protein